MRRFVIACAAITIILFGPVTGDYGRTVVAHAQEGHPLTGTWAGDWGATPTARTRVTIVMNWDGKAVTGLLNPATGGTGVANTPLGQLTQILNALLALSPRTA